MSGYLMLTILSPKSISMSRPLDIIISINFRNPIVHILQTPSLYQKRIKTRINCKNIRHLNISIILPKRGTDTPNMSEIRSP